MGQARCRTATHHPPTRGIQVQHIALGRQPLQLVGERPARVFQGWQSRFFSCTWSARLSGGSTLGSTFGGTRYCSLLARCGTRQESRQHLLQQLPSSSHVPQAHRMRRTRPRRLSVSSSS